MKKVSRLLCERKETLRHVSVGYLKFDGAKPNHCLENAISYADKHPGQAVVVSGWLVGDFLKDKGTAIIPHYWIYSKTDNAYYDTTPKNLLDGQDYDYLIDREIFQNEFSDSHMPVPLNMTADGALFAVTSKGNVPIADLDIKKLYQLAIES